MPISHLRLFLRKDRVRKNFSIVAEGAHPTGISQASLGGKIMHSSTSHFDTKFGQGQIFIKRSTWVWNQCVVITVSFQNRASRVILAKTGQMGHYKKEVSH